MAIGDENLVLRDEKEVQRRPLRAGVHQGALDSAGLEVVDKYFVGKSDYYQVRILQNLRGKPDLLRLVLVEAEDSSEVFCIQRLLDGCCMGGFDFLLGFLLAPGQLLLVAKLFLRVDYLESACCEHEIVAQSFVGDRV